MTGAEIALTLRTCRLRYSTEEELQDGIAAALTADGFDVHQEVRLTARDRIDLLVDRVGIEVKIAGIPANVERQLARYAASDEVDELVLVTNRARHRPSATIAGKPVTVVFLGGAL